MHKCGVARLSNLRCTHSLPRPRSPSTASQSLARATRRRRCLNAALSHRLLQRLHNRRPRGRASTPSACRVLFVCNGLNSAFGDSQRRLWRHQAASNLHRLPASSRCAQSILVAYPGGLCAAAPVAFHYSCLTRTAASSAFRVPAAPLPRAQPTRLHRVSGCPSTRSRCFNAPAQTTATLLHQRWTAVCRRHFQHRARTRTTRV